MKFYILKRFVALIPLFFGITVLSFWVIHLAPGSAADAQAGLNPQVSAEARQKLETLYGLDKPLSEQYRVWLMRLVRLDFGESFTDGQRVSKKIAEAAPVTLAINGLALFLILALGIALGVVAAAREGRWPDKLIGWFSLAAYAMPSFWLGLLLMSFFGVSLRILPPSGLTGIFYENLTPLQKFFDLAWHLVLPVTVTALSGLASVTALIRSGLLGVMKQNYIRTARAKGLGEREVFLKHGLKNALFPVITILGLSIPGLLGGSVILESLFSIPGMGRLFFSSVFARDYPVIMGILVIGAALTLLGNFLADLAYHALDPRLRKT